MSTPHKTRSSSARRVAAYRQRMREAGLVPKTIWVTNSSDPEAAARLDRAKLAIATHDPDGEAWVAGLYDISDWPKE